jgi:hypothetical protein
MEEQATTTASTLYNSMHWMSSLQSFYPTLKRLPISICAEDHQYIKLSHPIMSIVSKTDDNRYQAVIGTLAAPVKKNVFIKYCPIVDPVLFLTGEIQSSLLPRTSKSKTDTSDNADNSAYVDSTFVQLASLLSDKYELPNVVECYGASIGKKEHFLYDIQNDVDSLAQNEHFLKGAGTIYNDTSGVIAKCLRNSPKERSPITICDAESTRISLDIDDIQETMQVRPQEEVVYDRVSDLSSRESFTSESSADLSGESDGYDDLEDESETQIVIEIKDFAVAAVVMEQLEGTLDSLLLRKKHAMGEGELSAALMQIIMSLITFQKTFDLTHNDLHSSNIMFVRTDMTHIWYKYSDKYYKVPTFGKIWKIIDFGRSIYKYGDQLFCSSSFMEGGDAWSQYNFGPCSDKNSSTVPPNKSFDLCRLAVSLLDFMDLRDMGQSEIGKTITEWCSTDNGKNILYKSNGEERYPDFKLYKMIARTVTKHLPEKQLDRKVFSKFHVNEHKVKKDASIVDLDKIIPEFSTDGF